MMKKVLKISFRDSKDVISFIEYLNKNISRENIYVISEGNNVKIILKEFEKSKILASRIKKIYQEWKNLYYGKEGKKISLIFLLREADLKVAIPLSAINDILNLKGYVSKIEDKYLISDIDLDTLKDLISIFSEKYSECLLLKADPLAKRLVSVLATVKGINIDESIRLLLNLGLLKIDEKDKKYILARSYDKCIWILAKSNSL